MLELGRRSLLSARARAPGALFGLLLELSLQPLHAPLELDSVQLVDALVSSTEPVQLQALLVLSSSSTNGSCAIFVTHVNVRLDNGSTGLRRMSAGTIR